MIPQELIQSTGAATLTEALRTVPGITFGAGEGGNPLGDRPFLRGYDTQGSIYVDGMRDIGATTREVFNKARQLGVDMPITCEVNAVLSEGRSPRAAVENLLSREQKSEHY